MCISPANLHGITQHSRASNTRAKMDKLVGTLKTIMLNVYSVGAATSDDSKSAAKNDEIHLKASQLDRSHEAMKETLVIASYHEKIQILTLVPDA